MVDRAATRRARCVLLCALLLPGPCRADGGWFRVVNTGSGEAVYRFTVRFHRAPWTKRNGSFGGGAVAPGQATPWANLAGITKLAPVTLQVFTGPGAVDGPVGRVEFSANPPRIQPAAKGLDILEARQDEPPLTLDEGVPAAPPPASDLLRAIDMDGRVLTVECVRPDFQQAAQIRTDAEIAAETLARVQALTFKGRRPERFPTGSASGHRDEYRAGRLLGFTAVHGPAGRLGESLFDGMGYRYLYTYTHWLGMWNQGGGGYRRDKNDEHARDQAERWRAAALTGRVYRISVRDEANLDVADALFAGGMEKDTNYWSQVIRTAGLTPADFEDPKNPPPDGLGPDSLDYWKLLRGWNADDRKVCPRGVYNTMKIAQSIWPLRFANIRVSLRKAMGAQILTTANIHMNAYFRDNLSGIDPWMIYSRLQALDVPQVCDYLVNWPQHEEWLIDLQRCALRPHTGKPVDAMLQAQVAYFPRPPRHLKLCAMSAVAAGARSLSFYRWGPRYLATENWFDTDLERLRAIGEVNHAVGWVEDVLLAGGPPHGRIAILYSKPSELWDRLAPSRDIDRPGRYLAERREIYHLLRGLHRQVDMLNDDVLPADQGLDIDDYKVIFLTQRCITEKAASMLVEWVHRGGTLIGLGSIGQLDELEQPWDRMVKAFGLASISVEFDSGEVPKRVVVGANAGRPGAGFPGPIILRSAGAMWAKIDVSDAEVTARFEDGRPAVVERPFGKGRFIYAGFGAGDAYHRFSEERPPPLKKELRLLTGMQTAPRELVAQWIEPAGPPICMSDDPLVSARLIMSAHGSAVFLVNATGEEAVSKVLVTVRGVEAGTAESLEQGKLDLVHKDGTVAFELPLGLTDVVRLD